VIEELRELHGRFRFPHFMFCDDNFMGPGNKGRERALEFADAYRKAKLPMTFHIDCRAVDVHEEVMASLKAAGLRSVFIGIESVSDEDLLTYRKDLAAEANWSAVRILDRLGLERTLSMIMFNPATTASSIVSNTEFLEQAGYYPRNPMMILNVYEGTDHQRIFAKHLQGPFWDYRFEFERASIRTIYAESLAYCKDTLPLERELSLRADGHEARQEVYRLRLRFLQDMARRHELEPTAAIQAAWRQRLEDLRARVGAAAPVTASDGLFGRDRLFEKPEPVVGSGCVEADLGPADRGTFSPRTMGATPARPLPGA
jgi:hypothetical protein